MIDNVIGNKPLSLEVRQDIMERTDGVLFVEEITRAARSEGADLIALTTHGYTGLMHVLLGSTTERVVRHSDCPFPTIRREERSRAKLFRAKRVNRNQPPLMKLQGTGMR